MSTAVQVASSVISSTMDYYAGDPQLLNSNRYIERMRRLLCSPQSELLTIRTAIHTQLRNALTNREVQLKLRLFFDSEAEADASFAQLELSAKARASFFAEQQRILLKRVLQSKEQAKLKVAHGVLASWERENAILLRHPMFMTYHPSQALLLESAATVALYRQYAALNEGKYASESSDGEVPEVLKKLNNGAIEVNTNKFHQTDNIKAGLFFTQSSEPFHVDEHNKMYSQDVLHNKRVEYEQLRENTAKLAQALMQSESMKVIQSFNHTRDVVFAQYGIDKLMALLSRRDEELSTPYEGGMYSSLPWSLLLPQPTSPSSTTSMSSASNILSAPSSPSALAGQVDELLILSSRVAQYSLPKIIHSCYQNFTYNRLMHEADALMKSGAFSETDQASLLPHHQGEEKEQKNNVHIHTNHNNSETTKKEKMKLLKDKDLFTYWFLACLTADCPQIGPNKLVGKNNTIVEDYYKFWFPQKSSYVPTINSAHRISFGNKVADKRELPHFMVLAPVSYTYRENNDPNTMQSGKFDLMVYDKTNEEVLLIILNSHDPSRPHSSFVDAQEAKYRFAAVVRSALTNDNAFHNLSCVGVAAEYFFDIEYGEEESYYCVMAPLKLSHKQPVEVHVPIHALRPFTMCPPRFVVLGSNYGTSTQVCSDKMQAIRFAHTQLNEQALTLSNLVPDSFVQEHILSFLLSREDGIALHEQEEKEKEKKKKNLENASYNNINSNKSGSEKATSSSSSSALPPVPPLMLSAIKNLTQPTAEVEVPQLPREEEDMLSPFITHEVFDPLRDYLLERQSQWNPAEFINTRSAQESIQLLPSLHDGKVRTPLMVFDELLQIKQWKEQQEKEKEKKASDEMQKNNVGRHSNSSNNYSSNEINHSRPVSPQSISSTSRSNIPSYVELNEPVNTDNVNLISPKARRPSASATVAWFE